MDNVFFSRTNKRLNLDITYRCPLECLRCGRQTSFRNKGLNVPGYDISLEEFDKITNYFNRISFCGQYSDPIHHPKFIDLLEICNEKNLVVEVHVASSLKPKNFYFKAFEAYPNAEWIFGIDGLPNESHMYRVNQDGQKLYNIMIESKKYLKSRPTWQYIIFKYNEYHIDKAMSMAKEADINFMVINSARWLSTNDHLKPTIRR
jgi:MoaA/NifB/PqqE/SkfB family radical SAM enzyme